MRLPLRHAIPALFVFGAAVLFLAFRLDRVLTFDRLLDNRATLLDAVVRHHAFALLIYLAVYVLIVAIAVPGATLLTLAGGVLFGLWTGAAAAAFAAVTGASLLFLVARRLMRDFPPRVPGGTLARLREGFRESAWSYMLFLRLTPLCPFWLVNLAAAAAGIRLRTFLWTTALGILPVTLVFAAAGQNLDALVAASEAARAACRAAGEPACHAGLPWRAILTPGVLAMLIALSLVALAPGGLRVWRRRRRAVPP